MDTNITRAAPKLFYGWWVLVAVFLAGFIVAGGGIYSFVLFISPWTHEFGWSRAATAGLVSAFWFSAPLTLLGGYATRRFGIARLLVIGVMLEAVSVCLLAGADRLWEMYALRMLMGVGKVMFAVCIPAILAIWFKRHASFALSIAWAAWGFGGFVLGPATSFIIAQYGWRAACVAMGCAVVVLALLPLLLVLRIGSPSELGLGPDGAPPQPDNHHASANDGDEGRLSDKARPESLLRSGGFWLIAIATTAYWTAGAGVLTHQGALVEAAGFSAATASLAVGFGAGIGALSGPVFGWLLDKGYAVRLGVLMHCLLLITVLALVVLARLHWPVALIVYVVAFGLQLYGIDVTWIALLRRRFPTGNMADMYSAWYFFDVLTLAFAPIAVGHLFDLTGGYGSTMLMLVSPVVLSFILLYFIAHSSRSQPEAVPCPQ
jgi:MFS family permease